MKEEIQICECGCGVFNSDYKCIVCGKEAVYGKVEEPVVEEEKSIVMKQIVGYDNYFITDDGRVLNSRKNKFIGLHCDGKYMCIGLYLKNKRTTYRIHRLVAHYFVPNPNNCELVIHRNRNKFDNNYTNLQWVKSLFPLDAGIKKLIKHECIDFLKFSYMQSFKSEEQLYKLYEQSKSK